MSDTLMLNIVARLKQAAGHLQWEVGSPPLQPVGLGFVPYWRLTTA